MRYLMVNKFLHPNGGSETYIFKLGEALVKKGHEVQYFGMEHEGRIVGNKAESYTSDMDFHGGSKLKKLTYPLKTIYSSEARKKIRAVLDDFKPDVVHLNNFNYQLTPSIILEIVKWRKETSRQCKILFTAHDYQLLCPNHMFNNPATHENCEKCIGGRFGNCIKGKCIHGSMAKSVVGAMEAEFWKLKGTYKYIDKIICCSEFMKTKMDTNPVFVGKTVAMHNFIEHVENGPQGRGSWSISENEPQGGRPELISGNNRYVLYFGRFSKEKGVRTLIEAAKKLPEVKFLFAGAGEYAEQIEALPNAENLGFRSGKELDDLIRGALFSVCPSEWYENCPFSVMESQERLTPVLGARIGGIPELVEDGKTGWLFESGNAKELAARIKEIWEADQDLDIKKIRVNLQNLKRMDADQYADWLLDLISEIK
ncbi:Glycosyltransferase involved in cell wall bisynthesis [Butyrivibrio hungatei DSM 14810]|uniref:Glycosyltransferase involved in cell wall bisynthesis n=1 Tax=Butyrivibrio hungatei DSM 14810 TaxID=1121132 RepID=A0A1M7SEM8_9FIRM|nr:glycosyltransferase family 4 protein [Butyrivibrio hungatei]SHN56732.1 Glycosyltransferase involved in cell wall bisynthesis [Butyrivibrio hungatei DSM 14810]